MSEFGIQTQDAKFTSLGFTKTIVNAEQVCVYNKNLGLVTDTNPVLVLLHGYPQSSYMWRHLIPLLSNNSQETPIFVPDLPGYGASSPLTQHDKLSVGTAVLSALKTEVHRSSSSFSSSSGRAIPAVIIGHDRGARVAHRLAVSGVDGIEIRGVGLIDIVPTTTMWLPPSPTPINTNSNAPSLPSRTQTSTFHWPLLANVPLATALITSYGPSNWSKEMIHRWAGRTNPSRLQSLESDDALRVYGSFFENPSVVKASCEDYLAGATVDVEQQAEDQSAGRKIRVSVLLLYSEDYLGSRYDVPKEWVEWVGEGVEVTSKGLRDGIGHFDVEEAPQESAEVIRDWLKGL